MKGDINSDLGIREGFLEVITVQLDPEIGTSDMLILKKGAVRA